MCFCIFNVVLFFFFSEAKTHSNPENYIHSKYFDKSSEYYETNLTDTERRIAYNYEMQMCRTGKINGVNYQDSLFRGIEVDGDSVDSDKIQFERALVNSQQRYQPVYPRRNGYLMISELVKSDKQKRMMKKLLIFIICICGAMASMQAQNMGNLAARKLQMAEFAIANLLCRLGKPPKLVEEAVIFPLCSPNSIRTPRTMMLRK